MVFAPTHDNARASHDPAATPRRRDRVIPSAVPGEGTRRLSWRAFVHIDNQNTVHTTWHLVGCADPGQPAAHCPEGQRLLESGGDLEGHCLIDGQCPRCAPHDLD